MILLAFFFPLAVYLLVLGIINRRPHPLLVSGIWDGIGMIFGASGFLLFAGPAVLSAVSERWRLFWLFGKGETPVAALDGAWHFGIFLSILYFVLIVGGAAYYFWRQRSVTAIYNAEPEQVEQMVSAICERLDVQPVRSGGLFVFGLSLGRSLEQRGSKGTHLQAPHYLPTAITAPRPTVSTPTERVPDRVLLEQTAILEVEGFPLMRHVSLRWEPVDSPLRQTVETELSRRLFETPADDGTLGSWLLTVGSLLLAFVFAGALFLIALHLYGR